MWMGNPILTIVLFGLPAGFLSLICYGIFCPDILDADDDEEGLHTYFTLFTCINTCIINHFLILNYFLDHPGANHMKKD